MKAPLLFLALLLFAVMNCTKSIADEELRDYSNFHRQRTGASARQLLSDAEFKTLKVEIQYMEGFEPDKKALGNLTAFLYEHLHKPGGVSIVTSKIPSTADTVLSIGEVSRIEEANRTAFTSRNEIVIYVLYTNGYFEDGKMLGFAYRNTSAVLFGRNMKENSGAFRQPSRTYLETRVLQHEIGHLLGLVNVGSAIQSDHKDPDHGKHCTNKSCPMYYLTDTEESPSFLLKKRLPKLDKACIDDLKANGGK